MVNLIRTVCTTLGFAIALTQSYNTAAQTLPEGADAALHGKIPEHYQNGLVAVYDPQYPPSYFVDENNEMSGYVIDLQKAIARKLGVEIRMESTKFAGIITGMLGKRYDLSYFHSTPERREKLTIADFQRTGTSVMVLAGNPKNLDLYELCGKKVGVSTGGQQSLELIPRLQKKCKEQNAAVIEVSNFPGPNEGSLAVKTGRIDGWVGDAPYVGYIMMKSKGAFEKTPTSDLTGYSGFAFRKDDPMAALFKEALDALIIDGSYQKIMEHWNIPELGLKSAAGQ